ncbi:hypothetical protein ABLB90_09005 [Photorhabdus bodei]
MIGVSECSQQRGNLKDDGYIRTHYEIWKLFAYIPTPPIFSNRSNETFG